MPATIVSSSPTTGPIALTITRDKAETFAISVTQADGVTPQDLTGLTLFFYAWVGLSLIAKNSMSPSSGITIDSATGGLATLTILPADTVLSGITGVVQGSCELTIEMGSPPSFYDLASGTLTVFPNVGTP